MSEDFLTLGLKPTASTEEVKARYRSLAKEHHPDLNPGDAAAERKFKRITSAYTQALLSSAKRERQAERMAGSSSSSRGDVRSRPRPAAPVDPARYNVREWESAHYGMHGGRAQSQSHFVRNLAREHRARQAAQQAASAQSRQAFGGRRSFGWVLASVAAATALWTFNVRTIQQKFR